MRQVVLDTETTGLEPTDGHRVIEIGCVEVINRRLTGNSLHLYLNPQREIDEERWPFTASAPSSWRTNPLSTRWRMNSSPLWMVRSW